MVRITSKYIRQRDVFTSHKGSSGHAVKYAVLSPVHIPLHRKNIRAAGTRDRNELLEHRITGQFRSEGTQSKLLLKVGSESITSFSCDSI